MTRWFKPKYKIELGFYTNYNVYQKKFLGSWHLYRCCNSLEQAHAIIELAKRLNDPSYGPKE